ncbi:hypothetical protein KO361_03790 [Candidatus Woesearchaeota archaeon]|nr:hypothetical protein [Candidatus Woesearchaeota archaeon]
MNEVKLGLIRTSIFSGLLVGLMYLASTYLVGDKPKHPGIISKGLPESHFVFDYSLNNTNVVTSISIDTAKFNYDKFVNDKGVKTFSGPVFYEQVIFNKDFNFSDFNKGIYDSKLRIDRFGSVSVAPDSLEHVLKKF